jgi:hypothetical protein
MCKLLGLIFFAAFIVALGCLIGNFAYWIRSRKRHSGFTAGGEGIDPGE